MPLIGITADNRDNTASSGRYESAAAYSRAVAAAGGVPVVLPHELERVAAYVERCDGLLLTGGVDPDTAAFGQPVHERARVMDPARQAFELALLDASDAAPERPVLGICLGMQLMALRAGGRLDQYMPESMGEAAAAHRGDRRHGVGVDASDSVVCPRGVARPAGDETVVSSHRQAVSDAGRLRVVARALDGVIEAIDDPGRRFYAGVQWHPERGGDGTLSLGLIRRLVEAVESSGLHQS